MKPFQRPATIVGIALMCGMNAFILSHWACRSADIETGQYLQVLQAMGANEFGIAIALCQESIATGTADTRVYKKLCEAYQRANRVPESIAYFDSLHTLLPRSPQVALAAGIAHANASDYETALAHYQTAIALDSSLAEAYAQLVEAYRNTKRLDEAISKTAELVTKYPDCAAAHYGLGLAYFRTQRSWDECISAFAKAITLDSTLLDGHLKWGNSCLLLRQDSLASSIYRRGLRIARSLQDDEFQSSFSGNLAIIHKRSGDLAKALELFEEVAQTVRRIGFRFNEAAVYANIADIYTAQGKIKPAIAYNMEAIAIYEQINELNQRANRYINLGNIYQNSVVDIDRAFECFAVADSLCRLSGSHPTSHAVALSHLAHIHEDRGEFEKSLAEFNAGIELAQASKQEVVLAELLGNRCAVHEKLGNPEAALKDNAEAQALYRQLADTANVLRMLANRSVIYSHIGEHSQALYLAQQALAQARQSRLKNKEAQALSLLSYNYAHLGQYRRALATYQEALVTAQAIPDTAEIVNILESMGTIYFYLNQPDSSLLLNRRALRHGDKRVPQWLLAGIYANVGLALSALGQHQAALDTVKLGLRHAQSLNDFRAEGYCHYSMGLILAALNRPEESLRALEQSLGACEKVGDAQCRWQANFLQGKVFEARADYRNAMRKYEAAISASEGVREALWGEEHRSGYWQNRLEAFARLAGVLFELSKKTDPDGFIARSFQTAENAKARSMLDAVSRHLFAKQIRNVPGQMRQIYVAAGHRMQAKYATVAQELNRSRPDQGRVRELQGEIESLRSQQDSILLVMKQTIPWLAQRTLNLAEIQQQVLGPQQVLVEYLVGEDDSFVWIVTKDQCHMQSLGLSRRQIATLLGKVSPLFISEDDTVFGAARHRSAIAGPGDADFDFGAMLALHNALFAAPVAPYLPAEAELIIVPDDVLFYLPFEILVTEVRANQAHYLVEKFPISYSPSASLLAPELNETTDAAHNALALADPAAGELTELMLTYAGNLPEENRLFHNNRFTPLLHAKREVLEIQKTLPGVAAHYGQNASEARFKELAGAYRIIHCAVHGFANDGEPWFSHLVLARSAQPPEDGFLHANEIVNLNLRAEMVVLSACESGAGKLLKGEGLLSLMRAFFAAGARSVVASLWSANDESTARLMMSFYAELNDGQSRARALQRAKISLIQDRGRNRNPFYWAPFILMGQSGGIAFSDPTTAWAR